MQLSLGFIQLFCAASLVSALPSQLANDIQKRAAFDPIKACQEHRPAKDELMLLSYSGHNVFYDSSKGRGLKGLNSQMGDRIVFLLDQSCSDVIQAAQYEPSGDGNGWNAKMGLSYDGVGPELGWQVTIESHIGWFGTSSIETIQDGAIHVNGQEKWRTCSGAKHKVDGLDVDYFNACNFRPGKAWPRPWWPYGHGNEEGFYDNL